MKPSVITFVIFFVAQILLWLISEKENIATGQEILVETLIISLFIGLFFAGYHWSKWMAVAVLGLVGLLIGSMTFEGFGVGFLSVTFLYGAVIMSLVRHSPSPGAKKAAKHINLEANIIDWLPAHDTTPPARSTSHAAHHNHRYPLLVKRYQSLLIDFLILSAIMIVTMVIMGESESRQTVMTAMGVVFVFLYEPVLTTYAATLGQYIIGIRVRDARNPEKRINILQAYIRIAIKLLLGWLSLVTINFNPQHRAIHDMAGASVVIKVR